eukprot:TRINITY_DN4104_c0_g2_i3.p1 TRINITY_DN4104_c0_g2~~TRINITY_DN4104_c0_g2_i3.p1  ORF type:complete len:544 (-),score=85.15 TRINITY_DN4104_c0_g2_i3:31-1662(-)
MTYVNQRWQSIGIGVNCRSSSLTTAIKYRGRVVFNRKTRKPVEIRAVQTREEWNKTLNELRGVDSDNKLKDLRQKAEQRILKVQKLVEQQHQSVDSSSNKMFNTTEFKELRDRIKRAIGVMTYGLVERDQEVRLLLLAALSGEHALFIGPPGTAKSELGRRLSKLCDGTYFERLLTRFSVPEELFGPLSMRALEEDKYIRQTKGYLPQANVAFVDEIFKANSAILNTLLTLLNERLFDNGQTREKVPLVCLVGASNELPESEELDALYDRFLIRRKVQQVSAGGLQNLLQDEDVVSQGYSSDDEGEDGDESEDDALLSLGDFNLCRQNALREVDVPANIIEVVVSLRQWLQSKCEPPIYVSDRRLVKALGLLKVSAYTNGRKNVGMMDLTLLANILWQRPDEYQKIFDKILELVSAGDSGMDGQNFILAGLYKRCVQKNADRPGLLDEIQEFKTIVTENLTQVQNLIEEGEGLNFSHLWISQDDNRQIATALAPKFKASVQKHQQALQKALLMEVALEENVDQVVMASLLPEEWANYLKYPSQ